MLENSETTTSGTSKRFLGGLREGSSSILRRTMPFWWTERERSKGLFGVVSDSDWGWCFGMSFATRSPFEMEASVAMRVEEAGVRERARLQKGVWWQVRNSSFFQERTEVRWEEHKSRRRTRERVWVFFFMLLLFRS